MLSRINTKPRIMIIADLFKFRYSNSLVILYCIPYSGLLLQGPNICNAMKISSRRNICYVHKYLQKLLDFHSDFHILYHMRSKILKYIYYFYHIATSKIFVNSNGVHKFHKYLDFATITHYMVA